MAKPFQVPWTISDEDESGIGIWYLTRSEFGLAVLSVIVWYMLFMPVFALMSGWKYASIAHGLVVAFCFFWFITWMSSYRRGKPPSWLWDALMGMGILPNRRGLITSRGGLRWFSMQHVPKPAIFLTGAKKPGEDLTISAPWMQLMPPVVEWAPFVLPRRKRVFANTPSPAPVWFYGANGFEDAVNPRIPITVTYVLVPHVIPDEFRQDQP